MLTPADFMSRIVPWPGPGEPGFVNLHWKLRDRDNPAKTFWSGQPFNSLSDFMSKVSWGVGNPNIVTDIFFCLSQQSKVGPFKNGKAKVLRDARNATKLRAIWLDVDVKKPPKGYNDLTEAIRAVFLFCKSAGIPEPNGLVASGGGLHCYWISDRDLALEEWRPYAEGLKAKAKEHGLRCDYGVTADAARILRVPGTFNFKETVPREVRLLKLEADFDFNAVLSHITVNVPVTSTVTKPPLYEFDWSTVKVSDALRAAYDPEESLSDGIDSIREVMLNWGLIEAGCPFMAEAKATGGKDHSEPLWSLTLLAASFFQDGDVIAHELSNQHPGYSPADTDRKYHQKLDQRKKGDLGFPTCAKFEGEGSTKCAACPFKGKIKSPLNLGVVHPTPAPAINTAPTAEEQELLLPGDGKYFLDEEGCVCELVEVPGRKGNEPETMAVRLLSSQVKNPTSHGAPHFALSFDCQTDKETWERVAILGTERSTLSGLLTSLDRQGCMYNTSAETRLRGFFMAWLTRLNKEKAAVKNRPYGWVYKDGKLDGFSFGGVTYKTDGTEERSSLSDSATRMMYEVTGTAQPWYDALDLIVQQKRSHLDVMVLTGFATPLFVFTGGTGGTLGIYGSSGANKTSAMIVALAIWGDPVSTKLRPDSTVNNIEGRLANIDCLPLVVDDAQKDDDFQRVCKLIFDVTSGVSKGRMKQNATLVDPKKSKSSLIVTANKDFYDYMINTLHTDTDAAFMRLMQMEVPVVINKQGRVSQTDADKRLAALEHNHGVIGRDYAKWLVANIDYVEQYCDKLAKGLETSLGMREGERFWKSMIAAILAAGHFAEKAFGLKFDLAGVYSALSTAYMTCRRKIEDASVEGHTQTAVENLLAAFIHRYYGYQLWSDTVPMGPGKPPVCNALKTPNENSGKSVLVHWVIEERLCRISKQSFIDFLNEKKVPVSAVMEGMRKHLGMEQVKARLGSGINTWRGPQEWLLQIKIGMHHLLEPDLFAHCPVERIPDHVKRAAAIRVTATVTLDDQPITTGLAPAISEAVKAGMEQAAADLEKVKH